LSASSRESQRDEENYYVDTGIVPRKKRKVDVARRSATRKNLQNEKPSHSTKHVTESLFQDELDATTHEKQIADDVTNPFAFK
jgi:F0F1-type ATP synthase epsilon subunit